MTTRAETTFTMRHGHLVPQIHVEQEKQLMVGFCQYRECGRNGTHDMYCRVMCSEQTRRLLLAGDKDAEAEVVFGLFKTGLLLVGDRLCHTTFFFEEGKIFAETYYLHSIKI